MYNSGVFKARECTTMGVFKARECTTVGVFKARECTTVRSSGILRTCKVAKMTAMSFAVSGSSTLKNFRDASPLNNGDTMRHRSRGNGQQSDP